MPELPDAKKWFTGFIDVTRYIKDIGTIIRAILIICIAYLLVVGGVSLWKRAMPKPKVPTVTTLNNTGPCEVNGDKKTKFGLINLW